MPNAASPDPAPDSHRPLSRWTLFAFAFPAVPISAMGLPLVVHLPPFYAGTLGLGLTVVGTIFMLARFWDVFTDPVLGILSDRFETRWGRRRHWIVISVPIMMLSVVMIFMPPGEASAGYLIFWLFILYIGWTLLTISPMSWGAELTPDYHERSRVQGARELALLLGMVFVLALPVFIEQMNPDNVAAARVASMGWFVLILLPVAVALAVWRVPERPTPTPVHVPMKQAIGAVTGNRPLQIVLAADLISGVSGGLVASMFLFLAEDVLQLGIYSSAMLLAYFLSGVAFIPLMLWFSRRVGKHKAAAWSALFNAATPAAYRAVLFDADHDKQTRRGGRDLLSLYDARRYWLQSRRCEYTGRTRRLACRLCMASRDHQRCRCRHSLALSHRRNHAADKSRHSGKTGLGSSSGRHCHADGAAGGRTILRRRGGGLKPCPISIQRARRFPTM